jgi:hypothetical protein
MIGRMNIHRRLFLALSSGLLLADAPQPSDPSGSADQIVLALPGGARFACPSRRACLAARLPFRDGEALAVRFGWDAGGATQDLLALVAADGRLLALERLFWRFGETDFVTRFAMMHDHAHLKLERVATLPDAGPSGGRRRSERWTDYLLRDAAGLRDAPARPVLEGTLQAELSAERRRLAAWTPQPQAEIPPPMLAALRASPFGERPAGDAGKIG